MVCLKNLEDEISAWPHVSIRPHRFGGRQFRFGNAEGGHMHTGAVIDIPCPRSIRDALLDQGLADERHFVPNSGWITFRVRNEDDLKHASGSCGCHTCGMRSRPRVIHAGCWSKRVRVCA
jgi:hypothetical protein